ncbi:hypothetical protein ACFQE7_06125 [Nonomuraea ferruginea]|uniref:hypothetical protein n=1 Tax=Nonomuraea ferruginea TaxID=46174 RepID=UPI0036167DC6
MRRVKVTASGLTSHFSASPGTMPPSSPARTSVSYAIESTVLVTDSTPVAGSSTPGSAGIAYVNVPPVDVGAASGVPAPHAVANRASAAAPAAFFMGTPGGGR